MRGMGVPSVEAVTCRFCRRGPWNVRGWPTLFVIDQDGVIRQKWLGSPGEKVLDDLLDELVAKAEASSRAGK